MLMLVEKDQLFRPRMAAKQQLVYHICQNGQDERAGEGIIMLVNEGKFRPKMAAIFYNVCCLAS